MPMCSRYAHVKKKTVYRIKIKNRRKCILIYREREKIEGPGWEKPRGARSIATIFACFRAHAVFSFK